MSRSMVELPSQRSTEPAVHRGGGREEAALREIRSPQKSPSRWEHRLPQRDYNAVQDSRDYADPG